ncbi:hypothetical protein ISN44_As02g040180 [Arabidopsis suecica]|uniref:KIB1-4 beta-propeller domain-containing protein n=1 Tax=Arabidopsis suecica TaxID=45249 RepID=A0A8T2G6L7_ARASU|nr:hypothetical protein ISN44_As02g040180 [Arabidopsis suecica]
MAVMRWLFAAAIARNIEKIRERESGGEAYDNGWWGHTVVDDTWNNNDIWIACAARNVTANINMRDQILLSQARFSSLHTASGLNEIRSCGRAHESSETKSESYYASTLVLNPFTRESFYLPPRRHEHRSRFLAFSAAPTSPSCMVISYTQLRSCGSVLIDTWRPGETEWTTHCFENQLPFRYWSKCVFSNGMFFCLSECGYLGVFDPSKATWNILPVKPCPAFYQFEFDYTHNPVFMTEHEGDIFDIIMFRLCNCRSYCGELGFDSVWINRFYFKYKKDRVSPNEVRLPFYLELQVSLTAVALTYGFAMATLSPNFGLGLFFLVISVELPIPSLVRKHAKKTRIYPLRSTTTTTSTSHSPVFFYIFT